MSTPPINSCDSSAGLIQKYINTAYDNVKSVADNLSFLHDLYEFLVQYGLTTNIAVKAPVQIVATTPITLAGNQTISWDAHSGSYTVAAVTGNRVLVTGQTNPVENGIYNVQMGAWTRAVDFDGELDVVDGTLVFSSQGDAWQVDGPQYRVIPGEDPIIFRDIDIFAFSSVIEATQKAAEASASAAAALTSETNAKASEDAAALSEQNSKTSETNAKTSEINSKVSETNAKTSETNSKASEVAAENFATLAESNMTNDRTYPTVDAGIAATTNGQYFRVPQGAASQYSFIYYLNNSGTAVEVTEMIARGYVDARIVPGNYQSQMIPLFHDKDGNVPLWLDNSRLDAGDLGPVLKDAVGKIPNQYVPQGDFSPNLFPVIYDRNGTVPLWLDGGKPDAAGLGPVLQQFIKDLVGGGVTNSSGSFIEGDQYKFTFKKGRIFTGQSASLNVAFTGDSWTEKNVIPKSLISVLGGTYKDPGWISCSNRGDGVMAGISPVTATNFTKYDGGSNNTNIPPYGCGPDGNGYYNNNVVGSLVWTGVTVTDLSVFYYDGSGSFTIQIDTNTPVTITGGNTGVAKKYDFSGLSAVAHKVTIQSNGDGVVSILGMYGKNNSIASGITVSRMGNGGAIASDYLNFSSWVNQIAAHLDLDMLFIVIGTNDFRLSKGIDQYKAGLRDMVTQYRSATPGICICLVSPGQCNASGNPLLSEYDKAMRELAVELNLNFISGYQLYPKTYDNSGGAWEDALHMSTLGSYVLTRKIKDELFKE